ncbi:MAG: beta-ketoacyl-[acyl-carrier-protein] synthase family protein, partial [Leptospiraceae bacterium]|nr:beta-ketoacyl-[acyl-carrier-protein] synthase family protein [Leptospiraceae bacterium]
TAINNNIQGFVTTVSSACVGGHHAIALCYQAIRKNRAVVMYAGGHEFPLVKPLMAMYSDPKSSVMSKESDNPKRAIKPYDERRDGFILGEGAMVLCMENYDHAVKRGARIYAEVLGTLSYNEASHAMRMDISGRKGAVGLNKLLEITKIARDDLGYICGHGTATYNNDLAESRTYKLLFEFLPEKDRPLMGSIKPIFGHTFGAAGIINVGATALMLQNKSVCPTINHEIRDKEAIHDCVPGKGRKVHIKKAVSMAYAIGSQSSFVALSEAS